MTFDNFDIKLIDKNDGSGYFSLVENNRSRISTYFPTTTKMISDLASAIDFVNSRVELAEKREYITFVIVEKLTTSIIGTIFLKSIDWSIPKCEIGFFIDKDYEGKNITTQSVCLIVEYCFNIYGFNKLFMRIAEDNTSSRRVAEKNGFILEGVLRNDFKTSEDKLIDVLYYGHIQPYKQISRATIKF